MLITANIKYEQQKPNQEVPDLIVSSKRLAWNCRQYGEGTFEFGSSKLNKREALNVGANFLLKEICENVKHVDSVEVFHVKDQKGKRHVVVINEKRFFIGRFQSKKEKTFVYKMYKMYKKDESFDEANFFEKTKYVFELTPIHMI